ncbi:hypothetical protein SEUCBS140593_002601 [Sporothrix eucalyptigena]|uniref:C2 NT-type domain-containing protein n=1 Tax=Sporothrix eucalyptigena TaxID=1812306 RepID=A0ABP0B7Y3_9PEZI
MPSSGKAIADLTVPVHKSRKPKFELHLKIYDLNNVPLVSGVSSVKWHLPHSIHGEHRGRTHKQPIANHRVEYDYAKIIPLRLVVDRNNRLSDYPIEFEIIQEFETHGAGRDEKTILGKVTLNLAEYVAESEAIQRDIRPATSDSYGSHEQPTGPASAWHSRQRSSLSGKNSTYSNLGTSVGTIDSVASGPASTAGSSVASLSTSGASAVEDGVIRRYLMQESKINSTLKIGILLIQVDGERNYVAPPLKSAPVFGGITGIVASSEVINAGEAAFEDHDDYTAVGGVVGAMMSGGSAVKGHETAEIQDVYRRALAASWACQAGELPADECIEDIFSGGDGFRSGTDFTGSATQHNKSRAGPPGASLSAVKGRQVWSPSSPTASSIHEGEEEDDLIPSAPSRTSSGGKKHHPLLPKLGPIRRKTLPLSLAPGSHGHSASSPLKSRFSRDHSNNNGSSGDDGASGTGGGSGNSSGTNNNDDDDDDGNYGGSGKNATLRPSDVRKFRGGAGEGITAFASASALTGKHRPPGRELSGLSDRTVTATAVGDMEVPNWSAPTSAMAMALGSRSSHSSPGPQSPSGFSFNHRRDDSFENLASASSKAGSGSKGTSNSRRSAGGRVPSSGSRKSSGHGSGSGNGSGHDEQARRAREVHEYDVREDYVAWQLPGSITASS